MEKKKRVEFFHERMREQEPVGNPVEAWNLMSNILKEIETEYAPKGTEHMTILPLNHKDVQSYGKDGYVIPLIGYTIFINGNGAIGIKDDWNNGVYSLTISSAEETAFHEISGWRYKFEGE